ncbi:hypothetical protein [Facilibium subflavum]|uniref:hypothetical protein n=1 Tax=Facilibium subflavum TaxID=2219058 RepID=UPI000E65316C|nr:hypothetical protein [Facilibium subflavum]
MATEEEMKSVFVIFVSVLFCILGYANADQASAVKVQTEDKTQQQLNQLKQINQEIAELSASLSQLEKENKKKPLAKKQSAQALLSPMDLQAMNSPIFLPGGAPVPLDINRNTNTRQQSSQDNKDNPYKNKDQSDSDKSPDDQSTNSTSSDTLNNNYGTGGGYYPYNTSSSFKATFTPQNSYSYVIANTDNTAINPFAGVASNNITIKLSGNSTTYTQIQFCDSSYATCNDKQDLSSNSITISTPTTAISSTVGGYVSKSLTVNSTTDTYYVGTVYAKLYTSSSDTSPTNVQFSFPVVNCSQSDSDLSCSLTDSTSTTINTVS